MTCEQIIALHFGLWYNLLKYYIIEGVAAIRIPWDRYEVALLFEAYLATDKGENLQTVAQKLSQSLRGLARYRGVVFDETYRNENGMRMQLSNVQYLFTNGQRGLSGTTSMIRQMYETYRNHPEEYQAILEEAHDLIRLATTTETREPADGKERFSPSPDETASRAPENASELEKRILNVASECFPNGLRPSSMIDLNKLKRAYFTHFGEDIPASMDLSRLISDAGLACGEKVYLFSEEQKRNLRDRILSIFASGYKVIYFSELRVLHAELLQSCHLYESPLMRRVFRSVLPEAVCGAEWITEDRGATDADEIARAFGDDLVLNYRQIKERCPYLPQEAIRRALSSSERFVRSSPETYAQAERIQLDPGDVEDVCQNVMPRIQGEGYFSLAQLRIEESCALNPQVSPWAVRDAMFLRHMAAHCDRHGLIVTPKGMCVTTPQLLEAWCAQQQRLSVSEIDAYEFELTGHYPSLGLWIACNKMVRIDREHFVGDELVQFDVDAVDRAIALFVGERIIPIAAITSFTSFPEVPGYRWNLYLVESFLRRFSRRFTIDGGPARTSYVGGICSADRHFECYEERLAHAVMQDRIPLTEDDVGQYLTQRKFILRRGALVRRVLKLARSLNDQRGGSDVRL